MSYNKSISVNRCSAKDILKLLKHFDENKAILVCKGYDGDDENYTGLYWRDDKHIDFSDETYFDFQIWLNKPKFLDPFFS